MPRLIDLIPDRATLVAMHPAELAGYVLEVLLSENQDGGRGPWHRAGFNRDAASDYRPPVGGPDEAVGRCAAEAWAWLEVNLFICPIHDDVNGWYMPTRKGRAARNAAGLRALVEQEQLPDHFLHSTILEHARPLFIQGRHDLAVFEAFRRLEIAIREAAGLGQGLVGTRLAASAFAKDGGPLSDMEVEEGERQALSNLMCGALGSYKNPSSHRHVGIQAAEARDMIILASHLLKIVDGRRRPA